VFATAKMKTYGCRLPKKFHCREVQAFAAVLTRHVFFLHTLQSCGVLMSSVAVSRAPVGLSEINESLPALKIQRTSKEQNLSAKKRASK